MPLSLSKNRCSGRLGLCVFAGTVLPFLPALRNGFVNWDDPQNLLNNPYFRGFGASQLKWMFTHFHMGVYVPVTWMTYALDYLVWGLNPVGYHLSSILIHAGNAVLFFCVMTGLFKLMWPAEASSERISLSAAVGALIFSIHPLRVESVAWATERRDVVAGFFFLLTVLAYLTTHWRQGRSRNLWLLASYGFFLLSLLSKATAVALPIILSLLDVYPLRRLSLSSLADAFDSKHRSLWQEKIPFWVLSLLAGSVALAGQAYGDITAPMTSIGWMQRLLLAGYNAIFYIQKTLLPLALSPYYSLNETIAFGNPVFLLPFLSVAILTILALRSCRRFPGIFVMWFSYLFLLAPVSGLFQSGHQISADRYTYLPSLVWAVLGGTIFFMWGRRIGGVISGSAGAIILVTLGSLTWHQTTIWRDSETLWTRAVALYPDSGVARNYLGVTLLSKGEDQEAAHHFRWALRATDIPVSVYNNLGVVLASQGKIAKASALFAYALKLNPEDSQAELNLERARARRRVDVPNGERARPIPAEEGPEVRP